MSTSLTVDSAVLRSTIRRRSRRAASIGIAVAAGVGLVAGAGLLLLQLLVPAGPGEGISAGDVAPLIGYAVVLLAIGAAVGLQVVSLSLTLQMQQTFGSGQPARRLRRIVLRGDQPSSREEATQAAAYAPVAAAVIPQQTLASTVLLTALGLNLLVQLLTLDVGPVLHALQLVLLLVLIGTAVVLVPIQVRSARCAQHYRPTAGLEEAGLRG